MSSEGRREAAFLFSRGAGSLRKNAIRVYLKVVNP